MSDKIPNFILEKHPEMVQVFEAIKQYKKNGKITVKCIYCDKPLSIYADETLGFLNVNCQCGKSSYRSKWNPNKT
ncbi:hypothetical protein MNBD_GAMMA10-1653 [hydrothermal vent metagenome]|uniref:Uncharacterized protein n=1 Tax=hydrothermal vent metagenome TaxID=652676 RepID=A0A3B0XWJ9_9ZZZZ